MRFFQETYRGLNLLVMLNADRMFYAALVVLALWTAGRLAS